MVLNTLQLFFTLSRVRLYLMTCHTIEILDNTKNKPYLCYNWEFSEIYGCTALDALTNFQSILEFPINNQEKYF